MCAASCRTGGIGSRRSSPSARTGIGCSGEAADELDRSGQRARSRASLAPVEDNLVMRAARALRRGARASSQGAALLLTQELAGRLGDWRRIGGCGGGAAAADAAVGIDPAHATAVAPGSARDVPACLLSMTARETGRGTSSSCVDDRRLRHAGPARQSARRRCRPPMCSRAGTGRIAGRLATGAKGATIWRRRRSRWCRAIGDVLALASAQHGRRLRPHVGQRRDLLCLVRERRGARPGRSGGSAGMVASGDLSALRRGA